MIYWVSLLILCVVDDEMKVIRKRARFIDGEVSSSSRIALLLFILRLD
jgi:hypothetical protein